MPLLSTIQHWLSLSLSLSLRSNGHISSGPGLAGISYYYYYYCYYKVSSIKYRNIQESKAATQTTHNANNVESAESANSAVTCSTQRQLNCQSLIWAKSYHSLKCLSAHEGLVTHARQVQIVVGYLLCYLESAAENMYCVVTVWHG